MPDGVYCSSFRSRISARGKCLYV